MPLELSIHSNDVGPTIARLLKAPSAIRRAMPKKLRRVGVHWQRESILNAPEDRGIRGGLIAHIRFQVQSNDAVRVYVPANSPAGPYARIMHEHRGNWGPITLSKGARAGREYIKRARDDNAKKYAGWIADIWDEVT